MRHTATRSYAALTEHACATAPRGRICAVADCDTVLSIYNPEGRCALHGGWSSTEALMAWARHSLRAWVAEFLARLEAADNGSFVASELRGDQVRVAVDELEGAGFIVTAMRGQGCHLTGFCLDGHGEYLWEAKPPRIGKRGNHRRSGLAGMSIEQMRLAWRSQMEAERRVRWGITPADANTA